MRKQKAVQKKRSSGTIAIPSFSQPGTYSDGEDNKFPGCCGILVISGFLNRPMDGVDDEVFNNRADAYDRYDPVKGEYESGEDGFLNNTENLTKKEARRWWDTLCDANDVACLMATTVPSQAFVEKNLEAAGWKRIGRNFRSATSKNAITIWQYLHSSWK